MRNPQPERLPSSVRVDVRRLSRPLPDLPIRLTYRIRYSTGDPGGGSPTYGRVSVELYNEAGTRVGIAEATEMSPLRIESYGACQHDAAETLARLPARPIVFSMTFSYLKDRGVGLGRTLYELVLLAAEKKYGTTLLIGDSCAFGVTSDMAKRVYVSLQKDYIGSGLVVSSIRRA